MLVGCSATSPACVSRPRETLLDDARHKLPARVKRELGVDIAGDEEIDERWPKARADDSLIRDLAVLGMKRVQNRSYPRDRCSRDESSAIEDGLAASDGLVYAPPCDPAERSAAAER